ncbi:hypothetical protein EDD37DRAFT_273771 [Exophiala viscosa]|uniref:Ig-like domain-containing protein n=1 Tax=Exophiala viscosa TaxID=2486360 RepID=A0AAN6IIE0_9EURO|nr:hypothetical protein EDD36DRAFT_36135 [Exophiala viscosa]KAI1627725.1 hypothetical protein EDD37DRAFT_273771 [Exophiala viscosa]
MRLSRWTALLSLSVLPQEIDAAAPAGDPVSAVICAPTNGTTICNTVFEFSPTTICTPINGITTCSTVFQSTSTATSSSTSPAVTTPTSAPNSSSSPTTSIITSSVSSPTATGTTASVSSQTSSSPYANATQPTTSGTSKAAKSENHRLPGGTVAGIAIACSIGAALLAAGAVFFVMKDTVRKRRGSNTEFYPLAPTSARSRSRKNGGVHSKDGRQLEVSAQEVSVENALEQPKDDGTVKQSIASLFKAIEDHVDNFYLDKPVKNISEPAQQNNRQQDLPTGIKSQTDIDFASVLSDPLSRSSAIVGLICAELLDAMDFFGTPERSLLPEIVANFLHGSAARGQDNQRSRLYLSRWRTGTAYLLGASESPQDKEHRLKVTGVLVAELDAIIRPYCKPQLDNERRDHLLKLCKRAHELGLLLLSQPAEWRFYWGQKSRRPEQQSQRPERGRREPLVVQPQVCRLTDNMARLLDRPLVILERHVLH